MNTLALIAITWIGKEYRFLGLDWSYLMVLGFIGNALFSMRFLVQWVASERQGETGSCSKAQMQEIEGCDTQQDR